MNGASGDIWTTTCTTCRIRCIDLLVEVGARVRRPLTVVLERDGRFPPMRHLLWQLDRARAALAEGRSRERYGAPSRRAR